MNKIKLVFLSALAYIGFSTPLVVYGQVTQDTRTLKGLAALFIDYLNIAIYIIIAFAVVTFVLNVYKYFFTEKDKKEAGLYVMYSVIGFFVILSFWGLVAILSNSINLPNQRPNFPFGNGQNIGGGGNGGTVIPGF